MGLKCVVRVFFATFLIYITSGYQVALFAETSTNFLSWDQKHDSVDADISTWNLRELLEQISTATKWRVYLDPDATASTSVKFSGLKGGDALHAMLGRLNFLVVPETNGPSGLYVFRTSRRQATTLISPPVKKAVPIPNQIVVTLKPGSKTKIEDLAKSLGAKIIGRIDGQDTYLLQFEDVAATTYAREQLAENPDVAGIDNNYPIDSPPSVVGSSSANPDLELKPVTNTGPCQLIVGLIDTPIQSLGASMDQFLKPQIHVTGESNVASSGALSHATAMAETILDAIQPKTGGTTSVRILPVDVYGSSHTTSTFNVANGIVQAVNNGANIINLSLGGTGDSQVLHDTIIQVAKQGIPIYAAAGNDPVTTPTYPAAYPEVKAVTATDRSGNIASYANRGSFISMAAPGDNVVNFDGKQYQVEGTSTSTAFVSGAAAGLADSAHVCADQAQSLLQKTLPNAKSLKVSQ